MILLGKRKFSQSINLLKYRLSSRKEVLNYKPIYLTIRPIYRCNFACSMCLTHSKEIEENKFKKLSYPDMPLDTFKDIIHKFPEALAVGFTGVGEPLLHKDIFQMIDYAKRYGKMNTTLISNGYILSDYIDKILDSDLDGICISVNGHNSKEFNRMTGMPEEYFEKIVRSSEKLINRRNEINSRLNIVSSFIIDRFNLNELQNMIYFAVDMKFDLAAFNNILPLTRERAKNLTLSDDKKTLNILKNLKIPKSKTKILLPTPLDSDQNHNICNDFFSCITIDGEGYTGGCNRQRLRTIGTGKYTDKNVWNNNYFRNERMRFINKDIPLEEPCLVCYANSSYVLNELEHFESSL
jgi:MoaA/NifB/PqqE/SkfB family radical SAM enzyme